MARLCGEDFVDDYRPTIIANFKKVLVPVVGNSTVKLILWGTAAILLVYDISHPESLRCLSDIIFEIRRTCQKRCKFLLCGNKADTLESGTLSLSSETAVGSSRKVSYSQGLEFARHNNLDGFVEVSAKTMRNMDQMCAAFGRLALEGSKANKKMPFVAFATSRIVERCGAGSPAKLLSHNRALCESFGRDWVVGCCRQLGTTLRTATDHNGRHAVVHVFIGVSATLGVASCTWLGELDLPLPSTGVACAIRGRVGDDRFVASAPWGASGVVDGKGNLVAMLEGLPMSNPLTTLKASLCGG
ncbi:hypothetical protein Pelo_19058 [Pelomyxa schiedti]|nr:hypothetical protein Pelo_19058 [Pelomyxa schiedti]